jgi:fructosamine-3-kinase
MIDTDIGRAVSEKLGRRLLSLSSIAGGDINLAFRAELEDGGRIFIKTHPNAPAPMYTAESRGLAWLGETRTLRVPTVLASSEADGPRFLVLEYIESAPRTRRFDEILGHGLAALHRAGAPAFGLDHDNFIGSLSQSNTPLPSWARFYGERRLLAQLNRALERGFIDAGLRRRFDRLFERLDTLVGPDEPPARLHGDLWSGNLHVDEGGRPCLIDPAVYGGQREVDLAMMRLFGGFDSRVFAAYGEAWPLAPGHEGRVPLYQLYPLLVHLNLFGGGYRGRVANALDEALRA